MPHIEVISPNAVYSVADVADIIHSDQRAVRRAIEEGSLKSWVPNGCSRGIRILGQWVIDWMEGGAAKGDES